MICLGLLSPWPPGWLGTAEQLHCQRLTGQRAPAGAMAAMESAPFFDDEFYL